MFPIKNILVERNLHYFYLKITNMKNNLFTWQNSFAMFLISFVLLIITKEKFFQLLTAVSVIIFVILGAIDSLKLLKSKL